MNERLQVRLHRVPMPGVDVHRVQEIRDGMLADVSERWRSGGQVPAALRFLSDGLVEEARLSEMSNVGQEEVAAFFRGASRRRGVVRSFRVGTAELHDGQEHRRAAVVIELCADGGWWAAWRWLRAATEVEAAFAGEWQQAEGQHIEELRAPLQSWLDAGSLSVNDVAARWVRRDVETPPSIGRADMQLPAPVFGTPLDVARTLGPTVDAQVLEHGLPGVVVLVYRGLTLARWDVNGSLPCSIDDLVRGVCEGKDADAVAVIYGTEVTLDGENLRGVVLIVEREGRRARRVLPVRSLGGRMEALAARTRDLGDVDASDAWIGVEPESGLQLVALAPSAVEAEG